MPERKATVIAPIVPPQDVKAERNLLLCCLINPRIIPKLREIIRPEDFYKEKHRILFRGMRGLGRFADIITLCKHLDNLCLLKPSETAPYLTELIESLPSEPWQESADGIIDKAARRQVIYSCADISNAAFSKEMSIDLIYHLMFEASNDLSRFRRARETIRVEKEETDGSSSKD